MKLIELGQRSEDANDAVVLVTVTHFLLSLLWDTFWSGVLILSLKVSVERTFVFQGLKELR